jgi:hypothetical protein
MPGHSGVSPSPCGAGDLPNNQDLASRKWKFSSLLNKKVGSQNHVEEKAQADEAATIPTSDQRKVKKHFKARQ